MDPGSADLETWQAIALSVGGIALAWVVYDVLCRTVGQRSQAALAVIGTGLVALAAWGAGELFAPRAAYLQVGVMLGTIMAANVLFVIIPAHRKLVSAMEEKREPDPAPLLEAKNRSVHNNYLTLPVLFTMLAGHFAFVFGADDAWLVFVAIAVLTALIRVFFNGWHAGRRVWWIPAVAAVGVVALAFWLQPEDTGSTVTKPSPSSRSSRSSPRAAHHATREHRHLSGSSSRRASRSRRVSTTSSARPSRPTQCHQGTRPASQTTSGGSSAHGSRRDEVVGRSTMRELLRQPRAQARFTTEARVSGLRLIRSPVR